MKAITRKISVCESFEKEQSEMMLNKLWTFDSTEQLSYYFFFHNQDAMALTSFFSSTGTFFSSFFFGGVGDTYGCLQGQDLSPQGIKIPEKCRSLAQVLR